jgi:hypothetical protein
MRIAALIIFFSTIIFSCSNEDEIPKQVISQKEMQKILWDMLLADRYTSQYIAKDTSKKLKLENLKLYDEVLQLHKISKNQFIESFNFYLKRPDLTKVMFDSLSAAANSRRGEVYLAAPDK